MIKLKDEKRYWAIERTFLTWMHTAVVLGGNAAAFGLVRSFCLAYSLALFEGIGAGILGLVAVANLANDTPTIAVGSTLIVAAIIICLHSMRTFSWRGKMVKQKVEGPFDVSRYFIVASVKCSLQPCYHEHSSIRLLSLLVKNDA
jgi:uncharacterized membrane protein YidH (DUF202 family)